MMTKFNYQGQLEQAAKLMILVHEPEKLIREIVEMFVQKVGLKYAAALLHNQQENAYVLTVSGGIEGLKIPEGYARLDPQSPLINLFLTRKNHSFGENGTITYQSFTKALKNRSLLAKEKGLKELLLGAKRQMEIYRAKVCLPVSIQDREFLGILMLGEKRSGKAFTKEELSFFAALANDIAMVLKNAQLFEELKLTYQRLKQTQAARLHSAKMAMGFAQLGSFSHEVTNKIQGIKTFIQVVRDKGYSPSKDKEMDGFLNTAGSELKEIETVLNTTLSFYEKIDDQKITLKNISEVLEKVLAKLKDSFAKAKINLKLDIAKDLPQVEGKSTFSDLFYHLLINSYYGMSQREPRDLEIKLSKIKDEERPVEIKITDTGGDLTKEIGQGRLDLSNIYSPERAPLGGINFFLAYLITEAHHGTFDIQSNKGLGTIFIIHLPLQQPKEN